MKINYTNYLAGKTQETRLDKLTKMKNTLVRMLQLADIHGHISAQYFTDGVVSVSVNGEYYNLLDTTSGKWFSGFVGD